MQTSNLRVNHHWGRVLYFDLYRKTFLQRKLESVWFLKLNSIKLDLNTRHINLTIKNAGNAFWHSDVIMLLTAVHGSSSWLAANTRCYSNQTYSWSSSVGDPGPCSSLITDGIFTVKLSAEIFQGSSVWDVPWHWQIPTAKYRSFSISSTRI